MRSGEPPSVRVRHPEKWHRVSWIDAESARPTASVAASCKVARVEPAWDDVRWLVVFNGIADAWLWGFDADGWCLRHGDPAMGTLGILPVGGGALATLEDALWLADVLAYDHDAPVGVSPAMEGVLPDARTKDPVAEPIAQPIHPLKGGWAWAYWQSLNGAYGAAAELRFSGSYVVRYDDEEDAPATDFSRRFAGREELVGLYAMAARQADLLSEYLCLYRVLEAADTGNGTLFASQALSQLAATDFGVLKIIGIDGRYDTAPNAFDVYKQHALQEMAALAADGQDAPPYLYGIRNSIAHGKHNIVTGHSGERFERAARALPVVKLLARMAVEPTAVAGT
jgi:hypothetical protein